MTGVLSNFSLNMTSNFSGNWTDATYMAHQDMEAVTPFYICVYGLICIMGLVGNGLVIFVIFRHAKMKTVTNMYILNMAIADLCFLVGLPVLMTTMLVKSWVFGFVMCKIFFILTSINWFTSVFQLIVMSADRYLAVCHPVRSMQYRTATISRIVCIIVWTASFIVMLPIVLYATTVEQLNGKVTCAILWPQGQPIPADKAFIWYAFLLGFAIPVALISISYTMVLLRLRNVGPKKKSKEKKRSHRKVTSMVLTIIAVYVSCWLPYWIFQITLTFVPVSNPKLIISISQVTTILSYINSMLNPILYAFLSENFRKSFIKAFSCASTAEINRALQNEASMFPNTNKGTKEIMINSPVIERANPNVGTTIFMEGGQIRQVELYNPKTTILGQLPSAEANGVPVTNV